MGYKKFFLYAVIYLAGCVVNYKLCKADYEKSRLPWTVLTRNVHLVFSLSSWAGATAPGINLIGGADGNKLSKW